MKYISTRGEVEAVGFQDAVLMGLADDGGLIIPESIPDVSDRLDSWRELSFGSLAFEIIQLFATDIPESDLRELIERTYGSAFEPEPAPTLRVGDLYMLELWHGPTLSFKDIALQLLGNLFEYILARRGGVLNILGATSGDTGSAAIYGVRGRKGIHIFVMHPAGKVSPIQEHQMTSVLDDNVHNISLAGSFDDCQRIMKSLAGDLDFKRKYSLGAVNSVNWARVLAQTVYYFHAAFAVQKDTAAESVRFCVPTGNFGDVLAGWYAKQMGLPISRLILATNENDILSRFFNSGQYSLGEVTHTLSPAMDIQVASNFERYLYYRVGCNADRLRELMDEFARTGSLRIDVSDNGVVDETFIAAAGDKSQCLAAIGKYHEQYDYLLDPHTAVGVAVAESRGLSGDPVICVSTAHGAKFPAAIEQATGKDLAHHPAIDALDGLETRCESLPNDAEAVREFIVKTIG
ncbi:MAG: threonine synthase [Phycisphaerae bacterium]|nr:threonine synthase [Phycisphaerae bacterium]